MLEDTCFGWLAPFEYPLYTTITFIFNLCNHGNCSVADKQTDFGFYIHDVVFNLVNKCLFYVTFELEAIERGLGV